MIAFATGKEVMLVMSTIFIGILLYMMIVQGERKKKVYKIRRLPAMDAIEEVIGRGVEMNRPIYFCPGTGALNRLEATSTLAGLTLLSYIANMAVKMGCRIIVSVSKADVYALALEIVRTAFRLEGKEEEFVEEDIMFMPQQKSAAGMIQRENVAATFLMGAWWHEALVMIEAGATVGAMTVSGAAYTLGQLPWFVACSDYVLIGEEFYAASAYISRDPAETSLIAGQDYIKFICLGLIFLGSILATMGIPLLSNLFGGG